MNGSFKIAQHPASGWLLCSVLIQICNGEGSEWQENMQFGRRGVWASWKLQVIGVCQEANIIDKKKHQ